MKRLTLIVAALLAMGSIHAQTMKTMSNTLQKASYTFTTPEYSVAANVVGTDTFSVIRMEGASHNLDFGKPDIPQICQLVEIPLCGEVSVRILSERHETLTAEQAKIKHRLMPAQMDRSKSEKGQPALRIDSRQYASNELYGQPVVRVEKVGVARDRNLARLVYSPVQYNPVTGQTVLYTEVSVELQYKQVDVAATARMKQLHHSPAFGNTAVASVMDDGKSVRTAAPLHYLIVSHSSFRGELDSFIEWKKRQGFLVTVAYTDDEGVGTTNTAIASFIKGFYDNATTELPAPTYLLLVGDHEQIPAFNARCTSPASDHITDLYYTTWTSGDNIPDCYWGRFSAQNASQLRPQIQKSLLYEKYNFEDPGYLAKAILISGVDQGYSGDNAYRYSDPTMDYVAKTYVNADNGFTDVKYYKNNTSFAPAGVTVTGACGTSANASAIRNLYSQGYGWINYSAHGDWNKWHQPEMTVSQVASMNNEGKPSIMIGNCCLTNKFENTTCFGESLLRRGNNAGAVAYIGGTNSTYWNCDFYWAVGVRGNISNTMNTSYDNSHMGVYDRLFHTHSEPYTTWYNTMGAMNYAGNMEVENGYSYYALYYWEIYELMGDPSLIPWLSLPADMTVTANPVINLGVASYNVTAVPRAYVALTDEHHNLVTAAYANYASGEASLSIPQDITPGSYELAVWAQGYKPYFQNVTVAAINGPYLMVTSIEPHNGALVAGQTNTLDIKIANMGNADATASSIFISTDNNIVSLVPSTHVPSIAAGDTVTLTDVCPVYVNEHCADGVSIMVSTAIEYYGNRVEQRKSLTVAAPALAIADLQAPDQLTDGGLLSISFTLQNQGSAPTGDLTLSLVNDHGIMATAASSYHVGSLQQGASSPVMFIGTLANSLPTAAIPFRLYATDGDNSQLVTTLYLRKGINNIETFESNDFSNFDWQQATNPWTITTSEKYEGTHSARSKNGLSSNGTSSMSISWTSATNDSISFYYKVSSEANYDFFNFYIDGSSVLQASGEGVWTRAAFAVPAGTHTFKFSYTKDYSTTGGSDCVWIDNVSFPYNGDRCNFIADTVCVGSDYTFHGHAMPTDQAGVYHYRDTLNNEISLVALYVMEAPQVTITSEHSVEAGGYGVLHAHGAQHYLWSTGDTTATIVINPSDSATYTVTGFRGGCSSVATYGLTLAIDPVQPASSVSVYPNPASDRITVAAPHIQRIDIIDIMGKTILSQPANADLQTISLQNLRKGLYFIQVKTPDSTVTHKFVKQ